MIVCGCFNKTLFTKTGGVGGRFGLWIRVCQPLLHNNCKFLEGRVSPTHPFNHPSIPHPTTHPSILLSTHPSIHPSILPPIHPLVMHLSTHPSIHPTHLSICHSSNKTLLTTYCAPGIAPSVRLQREEAVSCFRDMSDMRRHVIILVQHGV